MKKTKPLPNLSFSIQAKDVPATQGMLQLVRTELKADIHKVESNLSSKIEQVMGAVHHVASEVARVGILVEEQNSRNHVVLEGLTGLFERQKRVESQVNGVEQTVRSPGRSAK